MSPVVVAGLAVPLAVLAIAAAAGLAFGAAWAVAVLVTGFVVIVAFHLWHLHRLVRWASDDLESPVPEGRGSWRIAFSALYRRERTTSAHRRDLARTIERFIDAAEALPDGMTVLDSANRIRWANARAQAHFGLDLKRDVGAPLTNLVRQPEFVRYVEQAEFADPLVIESQRAPGTTLSNQVVPFGIAERLLISRDITRLETLARMRRDFIANVSHELKTPLTVIRGFLETLEDAAVEPRQRRRYVELMSEQAASMERLVDDLLTLSTLESEQNPPHEAPFAVEPLMADVGAAAKALSKGRHAVTVDVRDHAMVSGSRAELASAFGNLASNAIRYTPEGGLVVLTWRRDAASGDGLFSVSDTGIGIAPEHVPRLTERFYRVDRSRSRETGGTGLGLAIVKHVLLRHQATLDVASVVGEGSTFTVRIPARRVDWRSTAEAPPRNGNGALATST